MNLNMGIVVHFIPEAIIEVDTRDLLNPLHIALIPDNLDRNTHAIAYLDSEITWLLIIHQLLKVNDLNARTVKKHNVIRDYIEGIVTFFIRLYTPTILKLSNFIIEGFNLLLIKIHSNRRGAKYRKKVIDLIFTLITIIHYNEQTRRIFLRYNNKVRITSYHRHYVLIETDTATDKVIQNRTISHRYAINIR